MTTAIGHKTSGSVTVVNLNSPHIESQLTANNSLQAQTTKFHPQTATSINHNHNHQHHLHPHHHHHHSNHHNNNNMGMPLANKDSTLSSIPYPAMPTGTVVSVAPVMMMHNTGTTGISRVSHRNKQSRSSPSSPKDQHRKPITTGNIKIRKN